jgi:hypothetical protein
MRNADEARRVLFDELFEVAHCNFAYRGTAVIPPERIAEFIDASMNGLLEVEPL